MKILDSLTASCTKAGGKFKLFAACGIVSVFIAIAMVVMQHPYVSAAPAAAACALFVMAGAFSGDAGISRAMFTFSFSLYAVCLLAFTIFGRGMYPVFCVSDIAGWLKNRIYWRPFENIRYYSSILFTYRWKEAFFNLFGNLAALAPLAFYLPVVYHKAYERRVFFKCLFGTVAFIETMQLILGCGVFDVDDFILNMSGAWLVYEILHGEKISKRLLGVLALDRT